MPRFLFDLELRATGRSPLHQTREIEATDVMDAITRATTAMRSPHWADVEITSLSVTVDLLTEDQRP